MKRAALLLLLAFALLLLAAPVSAHYGIFHNYKGPYVFLWVALLLAALFLYENLGDTPLGHAILFSGLLASLYPSLAYPHHELDAQGWQALAFLVVACFAFFLGRAKLAKKQQGHAAVSALFLILALAFLSLSAWAHDQPELFPKEHYTEPGIALAGKPWYASTLYWGWMSHDAMHWWFIVLMLWTCYHFRFVGGKLLLRHPAQCGATFQDKNYEGERRLHAYHRYFWFANVLLIAVHWHEVLPSWLFNAPYTYTYQYQLPGQFAELAYLFFFTLWLLSCHVFKYALNRPLCEGCPSRPHVAAAHTVDRANLLHGLFMWLALASMLALLLMEGHL